MNTIKFFLLLFLTIMLAASTTAKVYQWVDANGQKHYSDQPQPGAKEVIIRKPNVSQTRRPVATEGEPGEERANNEASSTETAASTEYTRAEIRSPTEDEVLWNIGGRLRASIALEPALQPGHKVMFVLDGRPVSDLPTDSVSAVIDNVFRGSHAIRASIYSDAGQVVKSTNTVNFFVRQGTVNN